MALNDICPDHAVTYRVSDGLRLSPEDLPSRRFRSRLLQNGEPKGFGTEAFAIRWTNLTRAELATIRAVWNTCGETNPLAWEPPSNFDVPTGRAWCINEYRDADHSANNCSAEMRLVFMPGVEPPA